ncbi:hypothetical protein BH11ARM2_BH11ARM2_10250 [soil metagenome]
MAMTMDLESGKGTSRLAPYGPCIAALASAFAAVMLLTQCGPCATLNGEFRLAPEAIAAGLDAALAVAVFSGVLAWGVVPRAHKTLFRVRALVLLATVLAFPVVLTVGSAWGAAPCLACWTFWAGLGYVASRDSTLGGVRTSLLLTGLFCAVLGTLVVRGDDYPARLRRETVQDLSARSGLVRSGALWILKAGDASPDPSLSGRVIVATSCSECLRRGAQRLAARTQGVKEKLTILAPNGAVGHAYAGTFPNADVTIDRALWTRFKVAPYGPPYLFFIQHGQIKERLP